MLYWLLLCLSPQSPSLHLGHHIHRMFLWLLLVMSSYFLGRYTIAAFGRDVHQPCLCSIDLQAYLCTAPLRPVSYLSCPALCVTVGSDHPRNQRKLKMLWRTTGYHAPSESCYLFSRGGGVLKKVSYGEAPLQCPTPYPFIYHFFRKGTPFVYLFLEKGTPFIYLL